MTNQECLVLMARILGGNIDSGEGQDVFVSSGPSANRTSLLTAERKITRAINAIDASLGLTNSSVNGFEDRFSKVIGRESSVDKDAFDEIGENLIQAVLRLKQGSGISLKIDEQTLKFTDNILGVNTTNDASEDNTRPITSAGVYMIVGNINVVLETI